MRRFNTGRLPPHTSSTGGTVAVRHCSIARVAQAGSGGCRSEGVFAATRGLRGLSTSTSTTTGLTVGVTSTVTATTTAVALVRPLLSVTATASAARAAVGTTSVRLVSSSSAAGGRSRWLGSGGASGTALFVTTAVAAVATLGAGALSGGFSVDAATGDSSSGGDVDAVGRSGSEAVSYEQRKASIKALEEQPSERETVYEPGERSEDDDDSTTPPDEAAREAKRRLSTVDEEVGNLTDIAGVHPEKPRIVILGAGWAAVKLLKSLDTAKFDVVVVSPRNYFLFTPLLPSATVGALESRSIATPVRAYAKSRGLDVKFVEAAATAIDLDENKVLIEDQSDVVGSVSRYRLHYDYLVVAIGAHSNTFGMDGVQDHCYFLKELWHARRIRARVLDALETASFAGQPEEERRRLLSFVVVGGGPTGCEFAAELSDFVKEDLAKVYPHLIKYVKITLVQSADEVLGMFKPEVCDYAADHLRHEDINLMLGTRVIAVAPQTIVTQNKKTKEVTEIPFEVCVWSTGVKARPLAEKLIAAIPEQTNRKAILTDGHLRVLGSKNIFALGDCATIETPKMVEKLANLFSEADTNGNNSLDEAELAAFFDRHKRDYPHLALIKEDLTIEQILHNYDKSGDGCLSIGEFKNLLCDADARVRSLPPTAQVASQKGTYLSGYFNALDCSTGTCRSDFPEFEYNHRGSMANIGNGRALLEAPMFTMMGRISFVLWRAYYWSEQVTWRNSFSVMFDWWKTILFGRDTSRV